MNKNEYCQNILLIFPPERPDLYTYLEQDQETTYSILFHEVANEPTVNLPAFIDYEYYWNDYLTPAILIKNINPSVIIFMEILDFRQIALALVAHKLGVNTIFLDHGITASLSLYEERRVPIRNILVNKAYTVFNRFFKILKVRWFYFSAFRSVEVDDLKQFLYLPILLFYKENTKAINKVTFISNTINTFILFNINNYERCNYLYHLSSKNISYAGIPYFDYIKNSDDGDHIIYIDHPYLEDELYEWSEQHHENIARKLDFFSKQHRINLYVKLHPKSKKEIWKAYYLTSPFLHIVQDGNFEKLYSSAKLILSFSSTMVAGFLSGFKNIVLLGWHPTPRIVGVDYSLTGLCHKSLQFADLETRYSNWLSTNKSKQNKAAYIEFIRNFNYPFDGNATKRIIEVIHNT